jgi:hypothetical protein
MCRKQINKLSFYSVAGAYVVFGNSLHLRTLRPAGSTAPHLVLLRSKQSNTLIYLSSHTWWFPDIPVFIDK